MSEPLRIFDSKDLRVRLALVAVVLFALVFAWFAVRWQLGNMLAELTPPGNPEAREVSRIAMALAPADPLARWLAARTEKDIFTPEKIEASVRLSEDTVRRSPYDFRWWVELGRAYEQADRPAQAEAAFKRAVGLAPAYANPHWQLGNFYVRQDRSGEAIDELKKTLENNWTYRDQVFSIAWDYFNNDPAQLEQLAGDGPDVRAGLTLFYAARERPADALRVWNTLADAEKARHPTLARTVVTILLDRRHYRYAQEFSRQIGVDTAAQPETVTNGGFEKFLDGTEENHFGWKLLRGDNKLDIDSDGAVRHNGLRSLKVALKGYTRDRLSAVMQVVAVEPLAKYRLSFWIKTENLKSAGPPMLELINANDNKIIAASPAYATGSNDWQQIVIDFDAPENCEGVIIHTARSFCGDPCPITGTLWYDDFEIGRR